MENVLFIYAIDHFVRRENGNMAPIICISESLLCSFRLKNRLNSPLAPPGLWILELKTDLILKSSPWSLLLLHQPPQNQSSQPQNSAFSTLRCWVAG